MTEHAARPSPQLRSAKTKARDIVVVCAKCAKRQGVSRREIGRRLKRVLKGGPGRVKLVETGCLGPCPKRMLSVATPASLRAGRVLLLDPALPKDALQALLPDFGPKATLAPTEGVPGADRPS